MISVIEVFRFHADQPEALADINHLNSRARLSALHMTQMSSNYISSMIIWRLYSSFVFAEVFAEN